MQISHFYYFWSFWCFLIYIVLHHHTRTKPGIWTSKTLGGWKKKIVDTWFGMHSYVMTYEAYIMTYQVKGVIWYQPNSKILTLYEFWCYKNSKFWKTNQFMLWRWNTWGWWIYLVVFHFHHMHTLLGVCFSFDILFVHMMKNHQVNSPTPGAPPSQHKLVCF